jgi:glycosyltransferase involved in cell wall biosynthesis
MKDSRLMKIIHIIDTSGFGGAEKYLLDLLKVLKKNYAIEIKILTFKENIVFSNVARDYDIDIEFVSKCNEKSNFICQMSYIQNLYYKEKYEIFHTHGYRANILVRLALFFTNAKIVTTVHSTTNYWNSKFKKELYKKLDQITSWRNNKIICVSNFIKDYYSNFLNKDKVIVIYNGIDNSIFYTPPKIKSKGDLFTIINVGSFIDVKNQITLVKAINYIVSDKGVNNVRLKLVGEGPNKDGLVILIKELMLENYISLLRFSTNVVQILNDADIYVSTSSEESFGLSIVEAMMAGLPIIAPTVGGIPEIIEDNYNGILYSDCYDYKKLANIITELICNEEKRNIIALNGQRTSVNNFTLDKLGNNMWNLYREL